MSDMPPKQANFPTSLVILLPGKANTLLLQAVELFSNRMERRWKIPCRIMAASLFTAEDRKEGETILLVWTGAPEKCLGQLFSKMDMQPPKTPESYLIFTGATNVECLYSGVPLFMVCSVDTHGILYGLGKLLHAFPHYVSMLEQSHFETHIPATAQRGIYFATHFHNFYEGAPLEVLKEYIEDLALWGVNLIFTWFDMSWFPVGFWDDPTSPGMRMIERLCFINQTARECGMRIGATAIANEGFRSQPPVELRADPSVRRGGFYLESQICPSKPGGMEMILQNRRKVLELIGAVDYFWYWPYDQGGCGCEQCSSPRGVRWGKKFFEIGPAISKLVKEFNPKAKFYISTWLMDEEEHAMIDDMCQRGANWFDGVLYETHTLDDHPLHSDYEQMVFPEISMFDCYFTSYGCNGANPAPRRFAEPARLVALSGAGAVPYSEGMFEDVNKIVWASVLWNPKRNVDDIVNEYAGYYLSHTETKRAASVIFALEQTWGAANLNRASLKIVQDNYTELSALEAGLPNMESSRLRWQSLRDRAEIDLLMKQVPKEKGAISAARFLLDEASCTQDLKTLRTSLAALCDMLAERQSAVDKLFEAHWAYMERFYMERTTLIFLPDDVIGGRDFDRLLSMLKAALALKDDEAMRTASIRAFKRYLWLNGIQIEHLFV